MRHRSFLILLAASSLACGAARAQPIGPSLLPPPNVEVESLPMPRAPAPPVATPHKEPLPVPVASPAADEGSTAATVVPHVVEPQPVWKQPAYWFGLEPWETSLELGINGSSGTSESLSVRTGGTILRTSRFSKLKLKSQYNRTTEGGQATQNNAQADARNDWSLDDESPWTLYGTGEVFYDQFQNFDLQASTNTGIGYRFIREADIDLIGRLGVGTSREFGGPDDRWVPESLVGFEYNQQLTAAQKFFGKIDYYPDWDQVGEFRAVADIGWQIDFAQPSNLSLKLSASDRYDSTSNGAEPHLLNYSVLLLLKL